MRKLMFAAALVLLCAIAQPAEACQECVERINYQNQQFCWECQYTNCGFFTCQVQQYSGWGDYCHNEDSCFTYEGVPYCGPDVQNRLEQPTRLADTWRLVKTRVEKRVGNGRRG